MPIHSRDPEVAFAAQAVSPSWLLEELSETQVALSWAAGLAVALLVAVWQRRISWAKGAGAISLLLGFAGLTAEYRAFLPVGIGGIVASWLAANAVARGLRRDVDLAGALTRAAEIGATPRGPCPRCGEQIRGFAGQCRECGFGTEAQDLPRHAQLFGPSASQPPGDLELSVVGPCYNCRTLGIATSAAVTFRLPERGIVAGAVLCADCDRDPYSSWMQSIYPFPDAPDDRLTFQVVGACHNCGKGTDFVMDLTNSTGKKMVAMSCSDACQRESWRSLQGTEPPADA